MRLNKQRKAKRLSYNHDTEIPVIHASICTGEQVAGLKNKTTGKFTEIMVIQTPQDLEIFADLCAIGPDQIKKEW